MSEVQTDPIVPSPDDPMYSVDTVATMFDVKPAQVRTWIKDEKIRATKILGRWRIQKSEVVRLANEEYGE